MMRCGLVTTLALMLLVLPLVAQQAPPVSVRGVVVGLPRPTTVGWWFRVNTAETKAAKIAVRLDTVPRTVTATDWWFHSGGRLPELTVGDTAARHAPAIAVQLTTEPTDARGSVCVFFHDQGVRLLEFAGQTTQQLTNIEQDRRCTAL